MQREVDATGSGDESCGCCWVERSPPPVGGFFLWMKGTLIRVERGVECDKVRRETVERERSLLAVALVRHFESR